MKKIGSSNFVLLWLIALAIGHSALAQVIRISHIEELYSAVNDPANAGKTLVLSPGTYMLSASDPYGVLRPKGGRIELQRDMSLIGVEGDRTAVVISALDLPATSFPLTVNGVATGPNASIRMGLGHNSLEWLTVRDANMGQANIDSGLQPLDPGTAYIRVEHVASSGSTRGLNVLNFGPQTSGQTIEADIVDCYFFANTIAVAEGVRIGNFQGARGSTINVRMSRNRSWGQKQGRFIVNNRALQSNINVFSSGNRFYENGVGTLIIGGLSSNNTRADGNTINFEAHGDQFVGNTAASEFDHGGLFVLGTEDISTAGGGSINTINVQLWDCRMLGNDRTDLTGIGARSLSESTQLLSQNNHVTIEIHGDRDGDDESLKEHQHADGEGRGDVYESPKERQHAYGRLQPVEFFADSLPVAGYGNSVAVIDRSEQSRHDRDLR